MLEVVTRIKVEAKTEEKKIPYFLDSKMLSPGRYTIDFITSFGVRKYNI